MALATSACSTAGAERTGGGSLIEIVYLEEEDARAAVSHGPQPAPDEDGPPGADEPDRAPTPVEAPVEDDPAPVSRPAPRSDILRGTHPIMQTRAKALVEALAREGIVVKLIFGYTPYSPRKRTGPGGWASWHEFGLAFDLNLATRKSLGDAKKHFAEDAALWRRIGEVAAEVGLVWGGSWRSSYDPFHFEWHPGHDSVINREDLRQLLRLAGPRGKNYQATWSLYEAVPVRGSGSGP